jgi:hypothetical protein
MPRPRSLSHDRIAAAALAVIDRRGLAALSMRTVAAELGMGTMSLYRYVTTASISNASLSTLCSAPSTSPYPMTRHGRAR